jgi:hypothetical protein
LISSISNVVTLQVNELILVLIVIIDLLQVVLHLILVLFLFLCIFTLLFNLLLLFRRRLLNRLIGLVEILRDHIPVGDAKIRSDTHDLSIVFIGLGILWVVLNCLYFFMKLRV